MDDLLQRTTGVILAGGKSSRMGSNKALLKFGSETIIERIHATLRSVFPQTCIVADNVEEYAFLGVPVYPDLVKQCGPLGGIHSALANTASEFRFIVSCDVPFINDALVRHIAHSIEDADVCVPRADGKIHPLCGIYRETCAQVVSERIGKKQLKLQELLLNLKTIIVPIDASLPFFHPRLLQNINSMDDYVNSMKRE